MFFDELWICHCGYAALPMAALYEDGSMRERVEIPMLMVVAKHPTRGPVLVDAPFGRDGLRNTGSVLGAVLAGTAVTFERSWSVIPRLEAMGVRPGSVNDVLITHMHFDHTGGMKDLSHTQFHVHPREWNYANALTRLGAMRHGYVPSDWRALSSRAQLMDLPPELGDVLDGAEGLDLFGDGSVLAIGLEGHAIGHTGYLFNMRDGQQIFYIGDAAYGLQCIVEGREPGFFFKRSAYRFDLARQTMRALRQWHALHPDALLASAHDPALGDRVRAQGFARLDGGAQG